MSGNAANEITNMLTDSIQKVEKIVSETNSRINDLVGIGKIKVELGQSVANECQIILKEIVEQVSEAAQMSQEITDASLEQNQGISEISSAMNQLDGVAHHNTKTSNDMEKLAQGLSNHAKELENSVKDLLVTVLGDDKV